MKKFFQIAAFALVGFIAFTSAKRGPDVYIARNSITGICNVVLETHAVTPNGNITYVLLEEFNGLNWVLKTFVSDQDARDFIYNPLIHRCVTPYLLELE